MSLRLLQFGATGQVARELVAAAPVFDVAVEALSHAQADLLDPEACAALVRRHAPDLVVLSAGYTAVDQAETERELAFRINAEAPGAIARACQAAGAAMVWFSTDYVFSGDKGGRYVETDTPSPLNVYGASKLAGERAVLAACPRALVVRTSWVVSAHGRNFVKTMLRLARDGQPLKVVDDQLGRPTAARDIARFVLSQAERLARAPAGDPRFGLVHFANAGETSWCGFARAVVQMSCGDTAPRVQPITTRERPAPAARPPRGTLDTGKLVRVFGLTPRPWRPALAEILSELQALDPVVAEAMAE